MARNMHVLVLTAHSAHPGKRVVILEGRVRGAGQSGKDTGELLAWNNHQLGTLQKSYGHKVTSQVVQSHLDAIEVVQSLVKQEMIPCQYTPVQGYIQASERALTAEAKAFPGSGAEAKQVCIVTLQCLVKLQQSSCCFPDNRSSASQHLSTAPLSLATAIKASSAVFILLLKCGWCQMPAAAAKLAAGDSC